MREAFTEYMPYSAGRRLLAASEEICADLKADGYDISLRQLFYALVSRGLVPNTFRDYKNLGELISNARLGGLFDWSYIVDRGRNLRGTNHYSSVDAAVKRLSENYRLDKWIGQEYRVEIWVEKDALSGVIARPALEADIDYFACKGYVSQSEMYGATKRFRRYAKAGQQAVILHFGDHDPSGLDMTRDIRDRLALMTALGDPEPIVERLALSIEQIRELNLPPNPVKLKDSRSDPYVAEFGVESWELDALPPRKLAELVTAGVEEYLDPIKFGEEFARERLDRDRLEGVSLHWPTVVDLAEHSFVYDGELVESLERRAKLAEDLASKREAEAAMNAARELEAMNAHAVVVRTLKAEVEGAREEAKHATKEVAKLKKSVSAAIAETADTTRASALKRKIEGLL